VVQDEDAPVEALADSVVSENGVVLLDGNTTINYQGRQITAENATYNPDTGGVTIGGNLVFESEGIRLESSDAEFDMDDNRFRTGESAYEMDVNGRRATGVARAMERLEDGSFLMQDATYSSCPKLDNSWFVKANRIELYPDDGLGIAKNIVLRFKGVPFLALPVFSFPIGPDRKTGFLAPDIARGTNTGLVFQIPWYWNILPNLDATFTPRYMTQRGLQLKSEFRYMNRQGEWILDNEIMSDRDYVTSRRRFTLLRHNGQLGPFWKSSIYASQVSDKDYFEDLGNDLEVVTHLERRADIKYDWNDTQIEVRLQNYQTVDRDIPADERPYRRLPQFTFKTLSPNQPFGLQSSFESEAVFFDRDSSVRGLRIDAIPKLSLPIATSAWFFKPSVRPRLYYLRVPHEDQTQIPVFDSNEFDFNIAQLFRENRFTGADRIADANQLSLALTSRLINGGDGREVFRGSIGQIVYFDDRRVSLEDEAPDTRDTSDFVGELAGEFKNSWRAKGSIQWNPDDDQTVRSSLLLSYRPDKDRIINLGHRNVSTRSNADTEQLDFSVLWPIANQWRVAARWNYSLKKNTSIESLLGIEYDSCCWAFRFAARRYIEENGLDHDYTLYTQLVLKGLAPLGRNYGKLLEKTILGYRDDVE